jgi:hypothetical protein
VVVLVVVLIVTNLVALGGLGYLYLRPPDVPGLDRDAAAALDQSPRPATPLGGTRRLITIEILNPIELAGTRGRLIGIAGSLAPGLTRRIVYDQTLRILKKQLGEQHVVADVRMHTLRPVPPSPSSTRPEPEVRPGPRRETVVKPASPDGEFTDEIQPVDLSKVDDRPEP